MLNKQPILDRLHRKAAAGVPIIGTGAGTGLTAKAEAEGGAFCSLQRQSGCASHDGRADPRGGGHAGTGRGLCTGSLLRL